MNIDGPGLRARRGPTGEGKGIGGGGDSKSGLPHDGKAVETGHSDRAEELILACGRGATTKWGPIQVPGGESEGGGQPEGVAVL